MIHCRRQCRHEPIGNKGRCDAGHAEQCQSDGHRDAWRPPRGFSLRVRANVVDQPDAVGGEQPSLLLYRIVDGLVDSFFPILADFDDRIDELEDEIFRKASDAQLQEIFRMKRLLVGMRKAVSPQRDTFASLTGGIAQLPGLAEED